jgi:hypothetical protein
LFDFLNKQNVSEAGSISILRQRSALPCGPHTLSYSVTGCHTNCNLLRYVHRN